MSIHTYDVPEIMCAVCTQTITRALDDSPFKHCVREISFLNNTLTLYLSDDEEAFNQLDSKSVDTLVSDVLESVGFTAVPKGGVKKKKSYSHGLWGGIGLSVGLLYLFAPLFFTQIPFALLSVLLCLSTSLTIRLGWPFYRQAYYAARQGVWTMDTLFFVSTAVILSVSLGALFFPVLPMMWEAGLFIFGFRHIGIAISDAFKANVLRVRRFQDDVSQYATLKNGQRISIDKVKPEAIIRLSSGDILPVDGVFDLGDGLVSRLYQTGSYDSEPIKLGQLYPAGTMLVSQSESLQFRAKETAERSFLAREDRAILKLKLNRALDKKKPAVNSITYRLQYFVPTVFAIAALSGLVVGAYFGSFIFAIQSVVCVLVAACPCTLGLIVPLVTHIALKKLENLGIYFREPDHLEKANQVDTVVFDLNGTITRGMPKVVRSSGDESLLALMAHLEQHEAHWVARAIKQAAKDASIKPLTGQCTRLDSSTHNMHCVSFNHKTYALGDRVSMEALGIDRKDLNVKIAALGERVIYLAEEGQLKGYIILEDKMRDGTEQLIHGLQAMEKKVYLCTGSEAETAHRYATALNIPKHQIFSDCTIEGENSKQAYLERLEKKGHQVAMIGDAGNDARAIAAGFGLVVAHEGGHAGAQQGASAVLRTQTLLPVLELFKLADKTAMHIRQNVWFSIVYNMIAMFAPIGLLFGFGVLLSPAIGAGLMILQTLLIFANVYRFDQEKRQPKLVPQKAVDAHMAPHSPVLSPISSDLHKELSQSAKVTPRRDLHEAATIETIALQV